MPVCAKRVRVYPVPYGISFSGNPTTAPQWNEWMQYARSCIDNGLKYFNQKFTEELSGSVKAFKAARLFVPHKLDELKPAPIDVDDLSAFPFLNEASLLDQLKKELPAYIAKAADLSETTEPLAWWKKYRTELPNWFNVVRKAIFVQPSSAAAERVFSILATSFGSQQDRVLQDCIECSNMIQYNL